MTNEMRNFAHVESDEALDAWTGTWLDRAGDSRIGLDVEEDRSVHYHARVALIQVTIGTHDAVIDPVAVGAGRLAAAMEALCLTAGAIVMHGSRNDMSGLLRDFGVTPERLSDTQVAARFLGHEAFGLAALIEHHFGVKMNKDERRSDWLRRPLTRSQIEYARADTVHLVPLWEALHPRVEQSGWADAVAEECDALRDSGSATTPFDPRGWEEIRGARALDPIGRRRAAALWLWRDEVGRRHDYLPSRIMQPWALLQAATAGPNLFDRARAPRGMAQEIIELERAHLQQLLREPREITIERSPRRRSGRNGRSGDDEWTKRVERLVAWRAEVAAKYRLDPGLLAPRELLEEIASAPAEHADDYAKVANVRSWRLSRWAHEWLSLR